MFTAADAHWRWGLVVAFVNVLSKRMSLDIFVNAKNIGIATDRDLFRKSCL
jgi:hypothetical protein